MDNQQQPGGQQTSGQQAMEAFGRFFGIIRRLRNPDGCPWDRDQTPLSMRRDLIEEVFEAVDAISCNDSAHAQEELGDVFLNTLMISYMYEQAGAFTVAEVFNAVGEKLVRRHPHVFTESEGRSFLQEGRLSPGQVLNQWEAIKSGLEKRQGDSILDEVPAGFPPLLKAYKLQKKAAKKGFDWKSPQEVYPKVLEEMQEVLEAVEALAGPNTCKPFTANATEEQNHKQLHLEEEIGDLFFALVNYARHLGIDSSVALERANEKFSRRFREVEKLAVAGGKKMEDLSLDALDRLWENVKAGKP
jgi:tetrapyrrole methylase family protein/MazG family protein